MSPAGLEQVRAAYVHKYGNDPEINIKSADFGEPIARLGHDTQIELMDALNGPQMKQAAQTIASLQSKAQAGTLTAEDRKELFSTMPMLGLWNTPHRAAPGAENMDAMERTLLKRAWSGTGAEGSLDSALQQIQSKLPEADLSQKAPREKSIAVIASSHGAQWQELMDWASEMTDKGYHLQIFTPEGQPVSFQRDSLNVSTRTVNLGYGAPAHLDPHQGTGELAKELLGNAAPSSKFDPKQFGAVYLAGGLGFNEDVAVAESKQLADGTSHTELTANPNIAGMMQRAIGEKLPIVGLCHGPTLLAATPITMPDGHTEALNKGIPTASLPPFESYVQFSGRKESQFTLDVNTHHSLAEVGGQTDVFRDIANMSRVVKGNKAGIDIITGPGPQASKNLADPTVEAMLRRWGK
jgi:putative intracellular protease/amidase